MVAAHCPRLETWCPEDNQAPAGTLREARGAKEVPEVLSNRNGEGASAISLVGHGQVISNTGFESPCSTNGESCRFSPLETPSALYPPQEAGFTLNQRDISHHTF